MPVLYLVRHAESNHNASGGEVPEVDTNLSAKGEEQARDLTGEFDLVVCSPMRRARRTVELSQIKYGELKIVQDAREQRYSESDLLKGEKYEPLPEPNNDMTERVRKLKEYLKEELSSGKKILLASHSCTIRYLTSTHLDGEDGMYLLNAELTQCEL